MNEKYLIKFNINNNRERSICLNKGERLIHCLGYNKNSCPNLDISNIERIEIKQLRNICVYRKLTKKDFLFPEKWLWKHTNNHKFEQSTKKKDLMMSQKYFKKGIPNNLFPITEKEFLLIKKTDYNLAKETNRLFEKFYEKSKQNEKEQTNLEPEFSPDFKAIFNVVRFNGKYDPNELFFSEISTYSNKLECAQILYLSNLNSEEEFDHWKGKASELTQHLFNERIKYIDNYINYLSKIRIFLRKGQRTARKIGIEIDKDRKTIDDWTEENYG